MFFVSLSLSLASFFIIISWNTISRRRRSHPPPSMVKFFVGGGGGGGGGGGAVSCLGVPAPVNRHNSETQPAASKRGHER